MFGRSKSFQNGDGGSGHTNSFYGNYYRNGNGRHFEKQGYEEEAFEDYNEQIGEQSFKVDKRALGAIVSAAVLITICYQLYQFSMDAVFISWIKYAFDGLYIFIKFILEILFNWFWAQLRYIWNYITDKEIQNRVKPFICGLAVGYFTWMMVYHDSHVPGLNPPSPFSPKSKNKFRDQKVASVYHGYVMAVASGLVVTGLMLGPKEKEFDYEYYSKQAET